MPLELTRATVFIVLAHREIGAQSQDVAASLSSSSTHLDLTVQALALKIAGSPVNGL